jgi:hypothetical protein
MHTPALLLALLVVIATFCYSSATPAVNAVTWYIGSTAQANNTALSYNVGDSLTLFCKATYQPTASTQGFLYFAITKGSTPPALSQFSVTFTNSIASFSISGTTVIYDDFNGLGSGYENFVIFQSSSGGGFNGNKFILTVGIPYLRTADAGTYFCSANTMSTSISSTTVAISGALVVNVNTKTGQSSDSYRSKANSYLKYSAILLGASKIVL